MLGGLDTFIVGMTLIAFLGSMVVAENAYRVLG